MNPHNTFLISLRIALHFCEEVEIMIVCRARKRHDKHSEGVLPSQPITRKEDAFSRCLFPLIQNPRLYDNDRVKISRGEF